jgi:hypothetical protein
MRRASAFADAKDNPAVGVGRPLAEGLRRPNSFGAPRAKRRPSPAQGMFFGLRRPSVGRRPSRRLKSAFPGATRRASAFADAGNVFGSAQAERWPKAFAPIEIGLYRRLRAGRRPSPTQATFLGRRRPAVGRRPSRRLKSAFSGACAPGVGLRRRGERLWPAQAGRWPKASGGRIHSAHPAPSVGLRRRRERFSVGAGRPLAKGLRRPNSFGAPRARRRPRRRRERFSVGAGRPSAKGLRRLNSFGAPRARRRPSPTQRAFFGRRRPTVGRRPQEAEFIRRAPRQASAFADASDVPRSAQAGRWPKASRGRIHSACRPLQVEFIRPASPHDRFPTSAQSTHSRTVSPM